MGKTKTTQAKETTMATTMTIEPARDRMTRNRKHDLINAAAEHFLGTIMAQAAAHYGEDTEEYMRVAPKAFAFRSYACCVSIHNPGKHGQQWFGLSMYDKHGCFITNIAC